MAYKIKRYGWTPDLPDHRDHLYAAPTAILKKLPTQVDLSKKCPAVYDKASWAVARRTRLQPPSSSTG